LAASPCTLVACIIGKKMGDNGILQYSMTDGVFGGSLYKKLCLTDYPFQFQPLKVNFTLANCTPYPFPSIFQSFSSSSFFFSDCETLKKQCPLTYNWALWVHYSGHQIITLLFIFPQSFNPST
jgi:hypothetical protein